VAGFSGHSNEPAGYIKGGKFFDQLSDYQLLKKDKRLITKPRRI
jgi:hypothetical protein